MITGKTIALAAATAASALGLATASAAAPPAASYVAQAGAGDLYEIKSSQIVLGSTKDAGIKEFANHMVADHTKSTAEVKAAAKAAGLTPKPPMLNAKQRADVAALTKASGTQRDMLYVQQQKAAHAQALALHRDYASSGDKPSLKATAGTIVPVVEQHERKLGALHTM